MNLVAYISTISYFLNIVNNLTDIVLMAKHGMSNINTENQIESFRSTRYSFKLGNPSPYGYSGRVSTSGEGHIFWFATVILSALTKKYYSKL